MKKLAFLAALLLPLAASAQISTGGRASVGVDYKVFKGFHIEAEEEVRTADNFAGLGSLRTSLGVSYKPIKYVKVGVGYTLINPFKIDKEMDDGSLYTNFWYPKHRVYGDLTGTVKVWKFQFSLKERLQFTHNTDADLNPYQSTRNALALKSKLGVKFKGWDFIEPSLSFELRTALNEPWGEISGKEQTTEKSKKKYYAYTHTGYTNVYNNRIRVNLGVDFKPAKHHTISPYVMYDYTMDYKIDTNGEGTRLYSYKYVTDADGNKSYAAATGWKYANTVIFGLNYTFSF